ncbi:MAG: hypothetical protein JWQ17_6613 [Tardiphaga sp.]|nr:hypothetical protein [Tardiphaga sp.]
MADYYPLIARAIAGLDPSAPGESRRALYERARSALIAQLRSVEPPLSESEITRERLSLEEAVRKVESEAAARARDLSRPDAGGRSRAGDAFRSGTRPAPKPGETAPPADPAAPPPARARQPIVPTPPQRSERPPGPDDRGDQRPPRNLRADPRQPSVGMQDPALSNRERAGAPRRAEGDRPPPLPTPPPIRGFRDVTADVDDLGRATAQAGRAARKTYANVPTQNPELDRLEPSMEDRSGGEPYSYDESAEEAARYQQPAPRPRPAPDKDKKRRAVRTGGGFPFKSAIAVGVVLILAGAAILWGPKLVSGVRGLLTSAPTQQVEAPKDTSLAPRPKIADRVGQPSSSYQIAPVAQRVVLYDEDPAEPKGKQYVGTVVWRTEQIKAAGGKPGDIAVRADIEIPDRKFKMTMSFRRNTDSSLPASHTAELTFILPPDFVGGGVANVPGILMKSNEQARGTPLAGLAVKVTDGFFLVGLSNVETDRVRNLQLLKERSWFDIPLVYTNQRRAIIAIEKGSPGERAFNDAFAAWGE